METNEKEFQAARKAERTHELGEIQKAGAKLAAIIRQHADSRKRGSGIVSPYPEMAARIHARAERGNGLGEEAKLA